MKTHPIGPSSIHVGARMRSLDVERVDALKESIATIGLLHPITVYTDNEGNAVLAAGAHRLEAVKALGWTTVNCTVLDLGDLQHQLAEIDENLVRAELSAAERAAHEARRKEIWNALHGEIDEDLDAATQAPPSTTGARTTSIQRVPANGENQVSQVDPPDLAPSETMDGIKRVHVTGYKQPPLQTRGFAASTAALTGESKETINRNVRRAIALGADVVASIQNTSLDSGTQMDALIKMTPVERKRVIANAAAGRRVKATDMVNNKNQRTVQAAMRALSRCANLMSPEEFTKLIRATEIPETVKKLAAKIIDTP